MLSNTETDQSVKKFFMDYFDDKRILGVVVVVLIIRLLLLLIPPQFTTDLARSIFYGQQFWHHYFDVYKLNPVQLDPNFNIIDPTTGQLAWPKNTYDYGVISLFFYAIIGLIPLPNTILLIIAKLMFTLADIITLFLLIKLYPKNKEIPLTFWIVMVPFTSIEGQPLSITILFFVLSLFFYTRNKKSIAYVLVAIGFHWKYVALFLLPYFVLTDIYKYYKTEQKTKEEFLALVNPFVWFILLFVFLMFPLLVSPYITSYISFEGNLLVTSLPWNPFYIGYPPTIASYLLLGFVLYILTLWYRLDADKKEMIFEGVGFIPLLGLFVFLMIYKYAFPWYWMWSIPMFSILPEKANMRKIFVIFALICIIAAIEFINWTVGYSKLFSLPLHL